jgi:hypothetical protein
MDVHNLARKYLGQLQSQRELTGIDAPPAGEKFILRNDKRFFYGMKKSKALWTYDRNLALAATKYETEAVAFWLQSFGTIVVMELSGGAQA